MEIEEEYKGGKEEGKCMKGTERQLRQRKGV